MPDGTLSVKQSARPERNKREHVDKVGKSLVAQRRPYESDWHQIADFSGYGNVEGLRGARGGQMPKVRPLMDSHPIRSFRTVEAGMYGGLSSPNRPWLKFEFVDPDLNEYQVAREWLDDFTAVILRMFDASNFYQAARKNYGEMARFGPACGMMFEHWRDVAPTMALPIGSYWLGVDEVFSVDTMMRSTMMTVEQVVKKFVGRPGGRYDWSVVSPNIKNQWDQSNYENTVEIRQLIEPGVGTQFDSIIWDEKDDRLDKVLECKVFQDQPFWGPRWDVRGPEVYGRGVGHDCLADLRELHMQNKSKRDISDLIRKPPTVGPARDFDLRPGSHTYMADMGDSSSSPIRTVHTVDSRALQEVRADIMDLREAIDMLTFADLFMAITNMPGVQPRNVEELIKRDEERLTQIGPVVEMVNDDMLPIAVDRMIAIAKRGGLIPEAPEELQGKELKVEFVSVLAMAQKMLGMSTTERFVGFVGSLGQVLGPQVLDKVDGDALVDDYGKRANVPAAALRDKKGVEEIRAGRAQEQQMAQAAAMAQPAKDATQAAKNLAEMSNDTAQF